MADKTFDLFNVKKQQLTFYHQYTQSTLSFKAFITQYSENWTNSWEEKELVRRLNKQFTFNSISRNISLAWDLPAYDIEEAKTNLNKCSMFARMLYPKYSSDRRVVGSNPVWFLSLMNLVHNAAATTGHVQGITDAASGLQGLKGFPSSFSFNPDLEYGVFDPSPGIIYPKLIHMSCDYRVIFDEALNFGWQEVSEGSTTSGGWGDAAANFPFGQSFATGAGAEFESGPEGEDSDSGPPNDPDGV